MQCPAGGVHNWVRHQDGGVVCTKVRGAVMSARCQECNEHLSHDPYPDEKKIAGECGGFCGRYLCEDCAIRLGGICTSCTTGLAEP